jgi:O-antigen ligase
MDVRSTADTFGRGCWIALGLSIPISVAVDGVLSALILLSWLIAARFRETVSVVRGNPVAAMACAWLAIHVLAGLYSIGEPHDIERMIGKAATFLLIPIAAVIINSDRTRERALDAFLIAIAVTLVLSCLRWAGAIPPDAPLLKSGTFSASVVFKYHLTQSLLLALGAFLFAVRANAARTPGMRKALYSLAALTVVNIMVMSDGRTGQLVLLVLMAYYVALRATRYRWIAAIAIPAAVGGAALLLPHSALQSRGELALNEAMEWEAGGPPQAASSIGNRLEFNRNSIEIFVEHPIHGVGTGGFPAAYDRHVAGTGQEPARNPHNEYLLQATELGLVGLALFGALLAVWWAQAARLPDPHQREIARALVLAFACASLVTSTLNDHTEGLLFVWMSGVLFSALPRRAERPAKAAAPAAAPRS